MDSFRWLAWHRPTPTARWLSLRHGPTEAAAWAAVLADPAPGDWCLLPAGRAPARGDVVTVMAVQAVAVRVLT